MIKKYLLMEYSRFYSGVKNWNQNLSNIRCENHEKNHNEELISLNKFEFTI